MKLEIVRADPAGNITIFVMNPPRSKTMRANAVRALMADSSLGTEQVGFVYPSAGEGQRPRHSPWRLEMAGGEFCGNAGRSFGLLAAAKLGLSGKHTLMIQTSGVSAPLPVSIDTVEQTAEIAIPGPLEETAIELEGLTFPAYVFEGITHIIAANTRVDDRLVRSIIGAFDENRKAAGKPLCSALGVMFYNTKKHFMKPVVWTRGFPSLVHESSCGSGSAALGVWAMRKKKDAATGIELAQPGGIITVNAEKQAGRVTRLSIAGKVTLGEPMLYTTAGGIP